MRLIGLLAFILTSLSGCAARAEPQSQPIFYVMRHLNTPAGERDPDLDPQGHRVAALIPSWFEGRVRPKAIYVSTYKRTAQSAAPLAERLGMTPIVYDPADTAGLVQRVKAGPTPALIVGHSNTVPDIVEQLGGLRPEPLNHEDFGDIWTVGANDQTSRMPISDGRTEN